MTVRATPARGVEAGALRQAVKSSLRRLFHPLHDWGGEEVSGEVTLTRLRMRIGRLAEVAPPAEIEVASDPAHLVRDDAGDVTGLSIGEDELVDLRVLVEIVEAEE